MANKALNPKTGLYELPIKEESVVAEIMQMAAYNGIILHRHKERIPAAKVGGRWHRVWTGRPSQAGMPDLSGYVTIKAWTQKPIKWSFYIPPAIYIEVKRPAGGRKREAQKQFIQNAVADGAIAFFARSWEECKEALKAWGIQAR